MIEINNMKHYFGSRCVLDIGHMRMESDRPHALIGHNGAGKTTLLRVIAGLEASHSGCVECSVPVRDRVYCSQQPYMFQGTVSDNLVKGLKFRGQVMDNSHLGALVARLGLNSLLNRKAKRLSTGEMQRVAIARALAVKPRILLLDEPTASVDPSGAGIIEEEIGRLAAAGTMIVVATHVAELAHGLGADIHRLENGRLAAEETGNAYEANLVQIDGHSWAIVCEGVRIRCVTARSGKARIAIPARDIVVSLHELDSSMANVLAGTVSAVRSVGDVMELTIQTGIPVRAVVTTDSFKRLHINVGSRVVVSFKATSVNIL